MAGPCLVNVGGRGLKNKETVTNLNNRSLLSNCGKGEGAKIKGQ